MVKFSKGQLVQYVPYHGAAHTGKPQNQGRILDSIIDTTNTFTGAYMVQNGNRTRRMEHLVREEDIIMSLEPFMM
ncbi:hypothetical protein EYB26_001800 [Talaromyces marneffei]|uniref:uncharacterized protein n=1 Tax=Talaromyces marneffei TaxID=37727 RepID=UPI0012A965AD|nr:uncharacterized protein EYB26_001800 [Talaromyces marneffei]QGA14147.1 hypothetical protein EYB26_001800 [Talaromyces marneffei]